MKKTLFICCLLMAGIGAQAQKSYINVTTSSPNSTVQTMYLHGKLPSGVKNCYNSTYDQKTIGDILNMLSEEGFEVEHTCSFGDSGLNYLLSKQQSVPADAIQTIQAKGDEKVTEVARFNLQGLPVSEKERGIQIIVYSNYTTKTVIVQ